MKTTNRIVGGLLIGLLLLSCAENSMQADAKKVAKLYCENQHLLERVVAGDESAIQESAKLVEKSKGLTEELMAKYNSKEEGRKFRAMVRDEAEKCD